MITNGACLPPRIFGPPLRETLRRLTGIDDATTIEQLADSFRGQYDTTAVAATAPYHGYDEVLDAVLPVI